MAKNMARLDNENVVINIEYCSDYERETATLKDCKDIPVAIGDTYSNGEYLRNGERVMSPSEIRIADLEAQLTDTHKQLAELQAALEALVEGITEEGITE